MTETELPPANNDIMRVMTGWREALLYAASHYQLNVSPEHLRLTQQWQDGQARDVQLRDLARQAGLSLKALPPA